MLISIALYWLRAGFEDIYSLQYYTTIYVRWNFEMLARLDLAWILERSTKHEQRDHIPKRLFIFLSLITIYTSLIRFS